MSRRRSATPEMTLATALGKAKFDHMMTQLEPTSLIGKLLIAMPGMGDPRFEQAVVLVCAHSADGAMGLIINKPAPGAPMDHLLTQLKLPGMPHRLHPHVHYGGPVDLKRGFVLHSSDWHAEETTLSVDDTFSLTATLDVLQEMSEGRGPSEGLLAIGYAGWGPGQLESEFRQNGWLTADASAELVFRTPNAAKWEKSLAILGVDPLFLSSTAGSA